MFTFNIFLTVMASTNLAMAVSASVKTFSIANLLLAAVYGIMVVSNPTNRHQNSTVTNCNFRHNLYDFNYVEVKQLIPQIRTRICAVKY